MSEFEGEPLEVVAMRTKSAHRDFSDWRMSEARQDAIAKDLKAVPRSGSDIAEGDIRIRRVESGFEVAFMLLATAERFIVLVIGFDREGAMESRMSHLRRSALEGVHPTVKALLEGRKRQDEL